MKEPNSLEPTTFKHLLLLSLWFNVSLKSPTMNRGTSKATCKVIISSHSIHLSVTKLPAKTPITAHIKFVLTWRRKLLSIAHCMQ
jgi:hypothetical protein